MPALGVLVSSTGPLGNIIKIRPPLVFSEADAARCLDALETALSEVPAALRSTVSEHGTMLNGSMGANVWGLADFILAVGTYWH